MSLKKLKAFGIMGLLASTAQSGGVILHDRNKELREAADGLGDAAVELRQEKEDARRAAVQEHRQASVDSMRRVNDSLEAEIKRMELRQKRQELDRAYWEFVRDSVKAARELQPKRIRKVSEIAAEEDAAEKAKSK